MRPNLLSCLERASQEYGISRSAVRKKWMDEDIERLERARAAQEETPESEEEGE